VSGTLSDLFSVLVDAREWDAEFGVIIKIPRANYSEILRNPEARIENRFNCPDCHWIVIGENPVRTGIQT
jgi:hypothetical protein